METSEMIQILQDCGAFQKGHFRLSSGLHSERYLQCAQLFQFPVPTNRLTEVLTRKLRDAGIRPGCVISPALGGLLLGYELSRLLDVPNIFAERDSDGKMVLRRGFAIQPGLLYLIAEDVVTTGGSTREIMEIVRAAGGEVAAACCVADRSRGRADLGVPLISLVQLDFPAWDANDCPLCREGRPIEKPGSRK